MFFETPAAKLDVLVSKAAGLCETGWLLSLGSNSGCSCGNSYLVWKLRGGGGGVVAVSKLAPVPPAPQNILPRSSE